MSGPLPKIIPRPVEHMRLARNGLVPDAQFVYSATAAQNHVQAYRKKMVFASTGIIGTGTKAGSATTTTLHRFRFHAGYGTTNLVCSYVLGIGAAGGTDPKIVITATAAGGAALPSVEAHYGLNTLTITDAPNNVGTGKLRIAVSANTTYEVAVVAYDYVRLISLGCWEEGATTVDTSVNYYVEPGGALTPIYDANRQRMAQGLSEIWKRNGLHVMNWSPGTGTAKTRSSATWANVSDATTAVASTSAGYMLGGNLFTPMTRRIIGTCRCVLAVYGSTSAGTAGQVRFQGDGGSTVLSVTNVGTTPQWYATEQDFAVGLGTFTKADLQFRGDGANTLSLYAVSLYLYTT